MAHVITEDFQIFGTLWTSERATDNVASNISGVRRVHIMINKSYMRVLDHSAAEVASMGRDVVEVVDSGVMFVV